MMKEKRQYKEYKSKAGANMDNVIAMLSMLEYKARAMGALRLAREIADLKKSVLKNNANKKLVNSVQKKYTCYKEQIERLESISIKDRSK